MPTVRSCTSTSKRSAICRTGQRSAPHHAVACRIRPSQHQSLQFRHLLTRQGGRTPAARCIGEPCDPFGIVAMHPVLQRLTVNAAEIRRIRPGHPVQHMGDRQNPTCNPLVVTSLRSPSQLRRRTVSPRHLNRTSQPNILRKSNFPHRTANQTRTANGTPTTSHNWGGWY